MLHPPCSSASFFIFRLISFSMIILLLCLRWSWFIVHPSPFALRSLLFFRPHSTNPFDAWVRLFQHKHCYPRVIMMFFVWNSVWLSCLKTRFSLQTEEFKDCPPGFLYILALSMVIKEVQADNELLSTRQYREGKFTNAVGIFVSFERFTCFEIGSDLP